MKVCEKPPCNIRKYALEPRHFVDSSLDEYSLEGEEIITSMKCFYGYVDIWQHNIQKQKFRGTIFIGV